MMCMGAILYEEISRIVYASTIKDSDQYICKEVICDTNELAKCAKSNIEIVKEYKREEAIEVLKKYRFKD